MAGPDCDLVIEGYPRSANTFAVMALRVMGNEGLVVGNHYHSPMQVALAEKHRIPAIVLFRAPVPAVASFLAYHGGQVSAREALARYVHFYRSSLAHSRSFVAAPFEEVTSHFDLTLRRCNQRFGCRLQWLPHSEALERRVRSAIEERRARFWGERLDSEQGVASSTVPSSRKSALARAFVASVESAEHAGVLAEAKGIYRHMQSLHGEQMRDFAGGETS